MLDSRILLVGGTIRITVPTYVDDVATTPSSITVTAYKNGIATGDSITPTLDHYGTGLSLVSYTPSGLAAGDTVTLKISATVSGTTRVTVAEFAVMSTASLIAQAVWDVATSALATAGSIGKYLLDRIIGTLAAGTHNPQSGDAYPPAVSAASSASSAASSASTAAVAAAAALVIVDHVDYGNEALADAIDAIDVGTGNGPNQVDVTVSSSAGGTVQGAVVRMQATGLGDHTATTNSSGVARFNLPSGTWNLTSALNGYSYAGSTQVVSTNPQDIPITMTVTSVSTPSSPSKSVGVLLCLDTAGDPESGVTVSFQMVAGPGSDGYSLDAEIVEENCDSEGVLEREFLRGATYDAWRGVRGARVRFVVPDAASFNLPEHLGVD